MEIGFEINLENIDDDSTPMITLSEVIEHIFCPRYTYFLNCLDIDQNEHLRYKVLKGREIHERREKTNFDYLRKRMNCVKKEIAVYLASKKYRVRGVVDEVLWLGDRTLAPLDYKYTEYSDFTFKTHKIQSVIYALLIRDNYSAEVNRGYICYVRNGNKLKEIVYSEKDFFEALSLINEIFEIIKKGYFPPKTKYDARCIDCCYRNICPK
ncbi:MAG: CRISPR-associated protein Cas4 [Calditerrivibrio sp.]|uniref:CRISPR-associated protein Cas4 n=1 Tax=Calditerrivibrio sp. TaxID=2792612 RepID=UPI003D110283